MKAGGQLAPIPWDGRDSDSGCGAIPGFDIPAGTPEAESVDDAFEERFTPDVDWEGCELGGDPVGAFDCSGRRPSTLPAIEAVIAN